MRKTLILIPSAVTITREMQIELGEIPPILVPINGKPIIEYIINQYNKYNSFVDFYVIIHDTKKLVKEHIDKGLIKKQVNIIELNKIGDLGYTIINGMKNINLEDYNSLIINFGDTFNDELYTLSKNIILYDDRAEAYRWTTFDIRDNKIHNIIDKGKSESYKKHHIFTGIFYINNIKLFFNCLLKQNCSYDLDSFYCGLKNYLELVDYELKQTSEWYDVGHLDNYYKSKKRFINTRYFNNLYINDNRGTIEKKSIHKKKLKNEILWYLNLPSELQYFIPRVFNYSLNNEIFVELEFYGYPCLSDIYLFGNYDIGLWNNIFKSIFFVINEMQKHRIQVSSDKLYETLKSMYIDKTLNRLGSLQYDEKFKCFFKNDIVINNKIYGSLEYYSNKINDVCSKYLFKSNNYISIIHGDLCIANILFDPKNTIIKLLDPRGEFGDFCIYGDIRYDLSKLAHSFLGKYEFIINDLFNVYSNDNKINFQIFCSEKSHKISQLFLEILSNKFPLIINEIMLIESLLFLSMVPLHKDHLKRQLVMLAQGIIKFENTIKKLEEK